MINRDEYLKGKQLYSTAEVAALLGITRQAVNQKIHSGEIKAEKIGRNYVVHVASLPHHLIQNVSEEKKKMIEDAVRRAIVEYGETFRRLSRE